MATAPSPGRQVVRFGACEADLRAGDLRKQSLRIGLPDSPLAIFLEHPGGVVARGGPAIADPRSTRSTPITCACAATFRGFDSVLPLCSGVPR
jgi:hypothetical protein